LFLDLLSEQFRRRAIRAGLAVNSGFAGAYDFSRKPDFGSLMQEFVEGLPENGVIMCHPGHVDEILLSLDPLTEQREREHTYLSSEAFRQLLTANGVRLD
jgi:chitin disaccharide deacetylase